MVLGVVPATPVQVAVRAAAVADAADAGGGADADADAASGREGVGGRVCAAVPDGGHAHEDVIPRAVDVVVVVGWAVLYNSTQEKAIRDFANGLYRTGSRK